MSAATSQDELVQFDEEFHELVASAAGNETLASMLNGVSSRTTRGRVWRGVVEAGATERTIAEHASILAALGRTTRALRKRRHSSTYRRPRAWFRSVLTPEAEA